MEPTREKIYRASATPAHVHAVRVRHARPTDNPTLYVAYTNPRCEARAQAGLTAMGYQVFLPLEACLARRPKHKGGGRERVLRPLFPRYLFVGFDPAVTPFYPIRMTDGVAAILSNHGAPLAVPARIMERLQAAAARGDHDAAREEARRFADGLPQVGARVRLSGGVFAGLEALVTAVGRKSVSLEVDAGRRPMKIEVGADSAAALEVV